MSDTIERLNAALEGGYRIERELGEGGMATVFLADDLRHERKVALKVLKPELAAVVGAERFLAEIKTTANLQHPHILPLFDSGVADGFLVLRDAVRRGREPSRPARPREGTPHFGPHSKLPRPPPKRLECGPQSDVVPIRHVEPIDRHLRPSTVLPNGSERCSSIIVYKPVACSDSL